MSAEQRKPTAIDIIKHLLSERQAPEPQAFKTDVIGSPRESYNHALMNQVRQARSLLVDESERDSQ